MIAPASLRGRLLLCMGLGLSVLWLVLAVWLHGEVRDRVARVLDQPQHRQPQPHAQQQAAAQTGGRDHGGAPSR